MIEYTITPKEYDQPSALLFVDIIPVNNSSLSTQTLAVSFSPELLADIVAEENVAAQKGLIRKHILSYNTCIQSTWEREIAAANTVTPSGLTELLGVPGTTPVTQEEINSLSPVEE